MTEQEPNEYFDTQIKNDLENAEQCAAHAARRRKISVTFIVVAITYNMIFIPLAIWNFLHPSWWHICTALLLLVLCSHMAWTIKGHIRDYKEQSEKWLGFRQEWLDLAAKWRALKKEYNGYDQ